MAIKPLPLAPVDSPAAFSLPIAGAIKALATGKATEAQQVLAYNWIVKNAGGIGAQSFRSGDSHATAFMEGRRFVAAQIVSLTTIDMEELKKRATQNE